MSVINKAQQILDKMAVSPDRPSVYYLGNKAARLTFLSQQHRAFNLVWALHEKGKLKGRIAVIGGGVAGMTAAVAAHQAGAEVTLLERKSELLHLQRGSHLRFVHPNIYDWPDPKWECSFTELPCLNWGAGMAGTVVEILLRQWEQVRGGIKTLLRHDVREIRYLGDTKPVLIVNGSRQHQARYDSVIVAVGFGLEKKINTVPFLSYWENDNFGQPVISGPIPRRYLVTGCGDGGLIDATRLRIRDFDHARFVDEFLKDPSVSKIADHLPEIDRLAASLDQDPGVTHQISNRLRQLADNADKSRDQPNLVRERAAMVESFQSIYIQQEYQALKIPKPLVSDFKKRLRSDTTVYLNGPLPTPMSLRSSVLNRFVVFLLRRYGELHYEAGRLNVPPTEAGKPFKVMFDYEKLHRDPLEVDQIVVRHGSDSIVEQLFPDEIATEIHGFSHEVDELTRTRQYPKHFLNNPAWTNLYNWTRKQFAVANLPRACEDLFITDQVKRFSLELNHGEPQYIVNYNQSLTGAESRRFESIPVVYEPYPRVKSRLLNRQLLLRSGKAFCGMGIQNIGQLTNQPDYLRHPDYVGTTGTLGCFVYNRDGKPAIFTSSFSVGPSLIAKKGDRIARGFVVKATSNHVIAELDVFMPPVRSAEGATLSAYTAKSNRAEGALAVLKTNVDYVQGFGPEHPNLPKLRGIEKPKLGMNVFKVGAGSGLTRGTVAMIEMSLDLQMQGPGALWFQGLVGILGVKNVPFATSGDSGAIVATEDGLVLGHILGTDGVTTYVCPAEQVFEALQCKLISAESLATKKRKPASE
jgi:hypothetical protein